MKRFTMRAALLAAVALLAATMPVRATTYTRESDVTSIRLGQRVYVDDATCPTGQIKEITGKKLSPKGILTLKKCVPRKGARPN